MAHHNSQQQQQQNDNNHASLGHVYNSVSPPLTPQLVGQQQLVTPANTHDNNDNQSSNIEMIPSQPLLLTSWGSSISIGSTSSTIRTEDKLFDQIEDMIRDYMRESSRHYLHCRVLRWSLDDECTQQCSAVVVINPPTTTKH